MLLIGGSLLPGYSSVSTQEQEPQVSSQTDSTQSEIQKNVEEQVFEIPLMDLGLTADATLNGPFQEASLTFNLPADWELTQPAILELNITSEFYSFLEAFTEGISNNDVDGVGGKLEITLNQNKVAVLPVSKNGNLTFQIELPETAFSRTEAIQTLKIGWDAVLACRNSISSVLAIQPGSLLRFTYRSKAYTPAISSYPKPFYINGNIAPEKTILIIPPAPTEQELSALLSIAAGLGKLTNGELSYELLTTQQLVPEKMSTANVILLGNHAALEPALIEMGLESRVSEILASVNDEDGLFYLDASPWNSSRALAIVTGKNDASVLKAASALGSNHVTPFLENRYALIKDVKPQSAGRQFQVDQTLTDLGSQDVIQFRDLQETHFSLPFEIPQGVSLNPEGYFEMHIKHSQLLDYLRSSITVSINDIFIGNVRLSDNTNENGDARFMLPPNVISSSSNILDIKVNLVSLDVCGDPRGGEYWASIFGDSYLHLPHAEETGIDNRATSLSDFPHPFSDDLNLANTTFVLEQSDMPAWIIAADLAFAFGRLSHSEMHVPYVKYPESISQNSLSGNTIVIGLSESAAYATGINESLPLAFDANGNWVSSELSGVSFQFPQNQNLGYLELTRLAGNDGNLISISGNSQTGMENAARVLLAGSNGNQLKRMNIAAITEDGTVYGYFIQAPSRDVKDVEPGNDKSEQILSPSHYPLYLLIMVVACLIGIILWSVLEKTRR